MPRRWHSRMKCLYWSRLPALDSMVKGIVAAMRDAALLKTVYAFGLRRSEAWGLDLQDLRHNPKVAEYGRFGALLVRYGKASRGSPPRQRSVLTVMRWAAECVGEWVGEIRPAYVPGPAAMMWPTERGSRVALNDFSCPVQDGQGTSRLSLIRE